MGWRIRVAWLVLKAQPRQVLPPALLAVWLTVVLFALGDGSAAAAAFAFVIAFPGTLLSTVWSWSGNYRRRSHPAVNLVDGLTTERLLVRRATRGDVASYCATHDAVALATNGLTAKQIKASAKLIKAGLPLGLVLITDKASGAVLGDLSFHPDSTPATCQVGWTMGPEHRGKGYGTEALRAVLPALHAAGITRVMIGTSPDNVAVHRVLDKVGATFVECRPHQLPNGTTIDSDWFVHEGVS